MLSNLYKVISRALNNRLHSVMDRLTTRAQKGFKKSRFLQEVLINTLENIGYCKSRNINGVIISIDQIKAFDSVSHDFVKEVYKFFNFGEKFIKK